jgi:hypothetical protein
MNRTLAPEPNRRCAQVTGHGQKLSRKEEVLIAALLTEPTHAAAAAKAGVSEATLQRWLRMPVFQTAYRQARREVVEAAVGRIQAATGEAVNTLVSIAKSGARDGDRVRAAVALLEHAFKGFNLAAPGTIQAEERQISGTADVVRLLAGRLSQVDAAELPTAEKSRLTATLADALLRAIGVDVLDKRLEALQAVLVSREENSP